ncbi:MAG: FtsB family cell division protein [Flavobacteriales bacterium]
MNWRKSKRLRLILSNRYALTGLAGLLWVTFVSDISLPFIVCSQWELNDMEDQIELLEKNILSLDNRLMEWSNSEDALERYARENYFMKREQEEIYRIVDAHGEPLEFKNQQSAIASWTSTQVESRSQK